MARVHRSLLAASLYPVQLDEVLLAMSWLAAAALLAIYLMRTPIASFMTVTGNLT